MSKRYLLICEYVHCFGRVTYERGHAATEAEAIKWVDTQSAAAEQQPLPSCDPIRRCPVLTCPAKSQLPRFAYRKI